MQNKKQEMRGEKRKTANDEDEKMRKESNR